MRSINGEDAGNGGGNGGKEERIFVSVRVRPLNSREIEKNEQSDWEVINNSTIIFKSNLPDRSMPPSAFTYDRVFGYNSDTRQVYEEGAKEVALSVVSGINSSIFAYGQTSSGKTYTMSGITGYTVEDIYDYIQKHEEREFVLKFSAMEIYNEAVRDLLTSDSTPLRLLDDPERGTVIERLTEETPRDKSHLKELLAICEAQRQIGETSLNEASSRSHQILRLTIESSAKQFRSKDSSSSLAATVNFVDLAGSERASQTLSGGTRLKEGSHINRSLLTLGTVIRKLSKGRNAHVPYRDSKLTRILQNSLGGNARTAIICTMSPARMHIEQSRNTLLFASCAKEVATSARVNVVMSDKALLKHLRRELARLEDELRYVGSTHTTSHINELKEKDAQIIKMGKDMRELIQQRDLAQSRLEDLLSSVGDDQASRQSDESGLFLLRHAYNPSEDGHSSRAWEDSSQFSVQLAPNHQAFRQWAQSSLLSIRHEPCNSGTSEDESSISEASGICYQSPEFGISKCRISHLNNDYDANQQLSVVARESENSMYSARFILQNPHQALENDRSKSETSEDLCKEVQCIETNDLNTKKDEFSLLLNEDCDSLLPTIFGANLKADNEPSHKEGAGFCLASEHQVRMRQASDDLVKPDTDELTPWSLSKDLPSFRASSLSTCSVENPISCTKSFCLKNLEENSASPCNSQMDFPRKPENVPIQCSSLRCSPETKVPSGGLQKLEISSDEELKLQDIKTPDEFPRPPSSCEDKIRTRHSKTASEVAIPSISNFVEGLKEMAQVQYQKQLKENQEMHHTPNHNYKVEKTMKDANTDPILSSSESPLRWALEFEKQQREIIVLWDACNVSLIHRTYFFLLFKGESTDSIYMEVERRRLSFLRRMLSQGNENETLTSCLKNLRREREMLHRRMQKKLSSKERKALYCKWGIHLNSKQRSMQLAQRLWTDTKDIQRVRESALLVSKLIGLLEPEQALKEMFGLSFTPQKKHRRSSSWMRLSSLR